MHLFSAGYYPAFGELILPDRDEVMSNSSLSTEVRGIRILRTSPFGDSRKLSRDPGIHRGFIACARLQSVGKNEGLRQGGG
jgi:hypothetical protein